MVSAACSRLLAANAAFHPLYGDRLSNHLPMVLIALDRMGASEARLNEFITAYSSRLVKRGARAVAVDPMTALGRREAFEAVYTYFSGRLDDRDAGAVLRTWLPVLMPGVAASAFHGLIRLAYAIEADDQTEVALALASWATEYQPLGEPGPPTSLTLEEIARSAAAKLAGRHFRPGIIVDRMAEVATLPAVQQGKTQPERIDCRAVTDLALGLYAAQEDFTLLHLVTACHAFAVVLPHVGDVERATRYLWQAALFAYLSTGLRFELAAARSWRNRSWQTCLERAVRSQDDHVIKLTYTAWRQHAANPNPLYLDIAWRKAVGLL